MVNGCYEGSLCDFLLWMISFTITCGVLAIFLVGVVKVIKKILGKGNKNE